MLKQMAVEQTQSPLPLYLSFSLPDSVNVFNILLCLSLKLEDFVLFKIIFMGKS